MRKAIWTAAIILTMALGTQAGAAELRAADNPDLFGNSELWYLKGLKKSYPAYVRACGIETSTSTLAAHTEDITRFRASAGSVTVDRLNAARVSGSVAIGPLNNAYTVAGEAKEYNLYVDAFLFGPDGRVYDVASAEVKGGGISAKGGKATFSVTLGKGHALDDKRVLVVAAGDPISNKYPMDSCVLLGAKWVRTK